MLLASDNDANNNLDADALLEHVSAGLMLNDAEEQKASTSKARKAVSQRRYYQR